ncbi:probable RNA-binding protein 19 [Schistocerca piceifrons]|uniref:probable RNA-binding protein 19 n=1 Tax=Schistocerca piceifrons TaxID=274613 RepID=UPI001F5E9158|nr:probable RNA-binding protein 19 [Schistocerca piceifrons]
MSRLVVKNLPQSVTEEKIRKIFSEKGVITDVQLKYTKDGKFRRFGFIGYKTEEEALRALEYFNNTCINASRIKVEICAGLGDPTKPKAWSKYSFDSSAYKKSHETTDAVNEDGKEKSNLGKKARDNIIKEVLDKHKDDPLFAEFMEVRAKTSKIPWNNDILISKPENERTLAIHDSKHSDDSGNESEGEEQQSEDVKTLSNNDSVAKKNISDLEYLKLKTVKNDDHTDAPPSGDIPQKKQNDKPLQKFFTVKVRGLAISAKKKDIKQFFHPLKPKSIRIPVKIKGIAYVCFKTEKEMKQALVKNKSFLAGRRIWVLKYISKSEETAEEYLHENKWKEQENTLKNEETIAESGRIFIRNLSYTVREDDIEKLFSKYGPLTEVVMPVDRLTRKTKGFGVVTFLMPEHAAKAYTELDGSVFHGRMLHLLPGKAKKTLEEMLQMEGLTFKQKKMLKMKAEAASSHNWNTLFLGQNAVADVIADTYNTTKDKVLDPRGPESLAVRLALGETQIVTETRDFLIENGVHLDAFNQTPKARSKTVILAKNLPAKTSLQEIKNLFGKYGELGRVILPPSGVTAIIEFLEPSEARTAFMKLAYTKFKHLPLYLEWAPSDALKEAQMKKDDDSVHQAVNEGENKGENSICAATKTVKESDKLTKKSDFAKETDECEEDDEPPEQDTVLFIKGLNFNSREKDVIEHFRHCGPVHYVTIAMKKDPKSPGKMLSMGYGFIQFKHKESADKALKTLQHSVIDGHSIELKRSNRTLKNEVVTARKKTKIGKQTGTKILVRNVPFQATKKEIFDLFKTFGELKAVRLPKKMVGTGQHRGFAFIDYHTKHDAKRAFKTLCQSTHLYGRRLVLEWAETEENVDELRKRTAEHFLDELPSKNLRKSTVSIEEMENS